MKTSCGEIPNELFENYLYNLIGRFYKILPLKETNSDTLTIYINSFLCELIGSRSLIIELNNDSQFMTLISTLQYFIVSDFSLKSCKRDVMKCINISKNMYKKYTGREWRN